MSTLLRAWTVLSEAAEPPWPPHWVTGLLELTGALKGGGGGGGRGVGGRQESTQRGCINNDSTLPSPTSRYFDTDFFIFFLSFSLSLVFMKLYAVMRSKWWC